MFFIGTIPAFVSFFAVALLTHYGDWDPVLVGLKKLVNMNQQVIERCAEPTANYHNVTKKIVFKPLKYSGISILKLFEFFKDKFIRNIFCYTREYGSFRAFDGF